MAKTMTTGAKKKNGDRPAPALRAQDPAANEPYGRTASGRIRKKPTKDQKQQIAAAKKTPRKQSPRNTKKTTKEERPTPPKSPEAPTAAPSDALDKKTYFRIWSIRQHLGYHYDALLKEDEEVQDIEVRHQLHGIAAALRKVERELSKVVPRRPSGDGTSPLSSPALLE